MDHLGVPQVHSAFPDVVALLAEGKKIAAIKAYRDETGVGLKEAKEPVERMM